MKKALELNSDKQLYECWTQLRRSEISKYSSNKEPIVWHFSAYVTINSRFHVERCWLVNRTRYNYGLHPDTPPLLPYHLAVLQSLYGYSLQGDLVSAEDLRAAILTLDVGTFHVSHTCGNGRTEGGDDTRVCCNPSHLRIRSKVYNAEQAYCHHFLHRSMEDRLAFYDSGLMSS